MKNRRKEPRRKVEDQVTLTLKSGDILPNGKTYLQTLTQDLSTGGLRLLSDVRLPVLSRVSLRLVLSRTRKILNLEGQVRWVHPVYEQELFEIGIEFIDVPPPKTMLLLKHIYDDTRSQDID
jgi:hypothetical protein